MTPQEQQLLQGLTARVNQQVLSEKDPEAEQYLQQSLSRNPDALYILAQTVLVQQYALDQAKQQLDQLKQQQATPPPQKHTSFLGNLLGMNDEPAAPPPQAAPQYAPVQSYPPSGYGSPQYGQPQQPPMQYGQPQYGAPSFGGQLGGQSGGFLQSALRTATGVAAGALAFEGIESLMSGFGHHAGYGSGLGGFGEGGGQPREEIINNYYGDSGSREGEHQEFNGGNYGDRISDDVEDRRDDSARSFADTDSDSSTDDDSSYDSSLDDSSSDDMSSDDNS